MYKFFFKRFLDFSIALVVSILLLPLLFFCVILLFFTNNGKPFFTQLRPGINEKVFRLIKLKTMSDKSDSKGNLMSDAERLTKIGKFIRKTSLDEIPQLFNVLKGDMSLIGPRPLLVQYLPLYNEFQKRRHEVRPGITGWAQINGRNSINWQQKFEYDAWYIDNLTFVLDIKIYFLTLLKVIKSENINQLEETTMSIFTGNES